jgi:hypothetical protein
MRDGREPSVGRSTRPRRTIRIARSSVCLVSLSACLAMVASVSFADASTQQPGSIASHLGAAVPTTNIGRVAGPHAVPPSVHDFAVPGVPVAKRAALSERTGSRSIVRNAPTAARSSEPLSLVAHVRSGVTGGYSMLGVTWDHGSIDPADVEVAVRSHAGNTWSRWSALDIDSDEGPASDEDTQLRDGTEPAYVGKADAVEVDVYSTRDQAPRGLAVSAIDPGTSSYDVVADDSAAGTSGTARDGLPPLPTIVTRRQWGADESLGDQCWAPRYGSTFKAVFVHHTAGSNTYTRRESPSIVRGIYAYHTQSRGWCDIGYNFLVDRYGTVYEGRAGGIRKPVRGAHAGDYNVNSTGISLMGEFTSTTPTKAMRRALIKLVTWRLGVAYHGGYGQAWLNGARFKRISGHRDAMSTACPGQMVYDWLPKLRARVNERLDTFTSVIKRYWVRTGGSQGKLGPVRVGEIASGGGRHTTFKHARVYFKDGRRRTFYTGTFLTAYLRAGETNGLLGYPRSDIRSPRNGKAATFEGGGLYWSPTTNGHVLVRGKIFRRYRHLDGASGALGFPRTRVRSSGSGSYARFQHGTITYDKTTGRVTVSYR